ncbi:MAG: hypothetical protein CMP98_07150 [Gammaproteobacteria bacterium]|nr:hypothetical protein [Gammaproteobacteria bacterium]OUU09554.1 MAG: hypothetical protein CBB94_07310 [Gammaproteobacteria bacterium TMED34]
MLSTVGDDAYEQFAGRLDDVGIHHDITLGVRTTSIGIRLDAGGDRSFYNFDPGGLREWRPSLSQKATIADADLVVLTRYQEIAPLFRALLRLPTRGKRVVDFADISSGSSITGDINLTETMADHQNADVCIFGIPADADTLNAQLTDLANVHHGLFVITQGEGGAFAIEDGKTYTQAAVPVPEVIDTTGAGDCFAAHFLSEWSNSSNIQRALKRGCTAASKVIQQIGAN